MTSRKIHMLFFVLLLEWASTRPVNDSNSNQTVLINMILTVTVNTSDDSQDSADLPPDYNAHDLIVAVNQAYGHQLLEGDIQSMPLRYRSAVKDRNRLWPNTSIPFSMDPQYDSEEVRNIQEAIAEFHNQTCIRFTPRVWEEDYIAFVQHKGCYSPVGRTGGQQEVTLGKPCLTRGTAIHEILHSLGFWHEQSRYDRDDYIQIVWSNIEEGREFNFEKFSQSDMDVLSAPYDYGSVMHYSRTAFSKDGNSTILPKKPTNKTLGQREHLSDIDAWKVNILYRCPNTKPLLPDERTPPTLGTGIPSKFHPPLVPPKLPAPTPRDVSTTPSRHIRTPPPIHHHYFAWGPFTDWSPCDIDCISKRTRYCLDFIKGNCGPGPSVETSVCPPPCRSAQYIGCWENRLSDPAIPMIENQRSSTLDFHTLEAYRECADAAMELGYPVFALFRDGDCLTGPDALFTFAKYGKSTMCGRTGQGSNDAMDVYTYIQDIDGEWSEWASWGRCSERCGAGTSTRRRYCNSPPYTGEGEPCEGRDEETRSCQERPCQDTDGGWSDWSAWTSCTRFCGVGTRYRFRKCDNPEPSGGGAPCAGEDKDTGHCFLLHCEQSPGCGTQTHNGTQGVINQGGYDGYMACEFRVVTYTGFTIVLTVDSIDVEDSPGCEDDLLMIFDGNSTRAPVLGTLCGRRPHPPLHSSGSELFVLFQSDYTVGGRGFTLTWRATNSTADKCPTPVEPFHGSMVGYSTYVGDSFRFKCQQGYHLIGPSVITCVRSDEHEAEWDGKYPRCDEDVLELDHV